MKPNNTPPPDETTEEITDDRLTSGLEEGRTKSVLPSFHASTW